MSLNTTPLPPGMAWLAAIRQPQAALAWSLGEWERVIRLSRRLRLLGRLAEAVEAAGLMQQIPAPAARHLGAEMRFSRWRTNALRWTLERITAPLRDAHYPLVLLKGAAYIGQGLPIASGRLSSDLDILVPQANLADAQARLVGTGWVEQELDEHDQRYYREWSHEVPPMRHPVLEMELDLHHNILPPVAHTRVDAELLLQRLQDSGLPPWKVLHPQDQVLHSACHLFHDSEARDRLRDLVDLDGLLRHFGHQDGFWQGLPARAAELGLSEPLALACQFAEQWLQTPIPAQAREQIRNAGPSRLKRAWLHPLMKHLLTPTEPDFEHGWRQDLAAQALLVRYHYRRMPLRILVPHLWHKTRARRLAAAEQAAAARGDDRG